MVVGIGPLFFKLNGLPESWSSSEGSRKVEGFVRTVPPQSDAIPYTLNVVKRLDHPPLKSFRQVGHVSCCNECGGQRQFFITDEMKSLIDWESRNIDIELLPSTEIPEFDATMKIMVQLRLLVSFAVVRAGGIPLHCSSVRKDDKALVFFGRSGAGKSTVARILEAEDWEILNDEYNLLIPWNHTFRVFSTPFSKVNGPLVNTPEGVAIAGLFHLNRGDFSVGKQSVEQNMRAILESVYMFPDFDGVRNSLLDVVYSLCKKAAVFELFFRKTSDTAGMLERVIREEHCWRQGM